jgi:hypothetical protein
MDVATQIATTYKSPTIQRFITHRTARRHACLRSAPAALAGIGTLPATLRDRSIIIPLVQAEEGQIAIPFDSLKIEAETIIARKLARWANDNFAALAACKPALPPGAFNRLADNWRPLFAIAEVAGGEWPRRALEAFTLLKPQRVKTLPPGELLSLVRSSFRQSGVTRMFSRELVASLRSLYGNIVNVQGTAGGASNRRAIDESWVARELQRFGVTPHNIRIGDEQAKGYELEDFRQAFASHLDEGFSE